MLRSSENWIVIEVDPSPLDDVMLSMPAIIENCFSSGVATAAAIVSGLAPGRFAVTRRVGKSELGRSLTGNARYAIIPKSAIASIMRLVAIGRSMKIFDIFIAYGTRMNTGPNGTSRIDLFRTLQPMTNDQ